MQRIPEITHPRQPGAFLVISRVESSKEESWRKASEEGMYTTSTTGDGWADMTTDRVVSRPCRTSDTCHSLASLYSIPYSPIRETMRS